MDRLRAVDVSTVKIDLLTGCQTPQSLKSGSRLERGVITRTQLGLVTMAGGVSSCGSRGITHSNVFTTTWVHGRLKIIALSG